MNIVDIVNELIRQDEERDLICFKLNETYAEIKDRKTGLLIIELKEKQTVAHITFKIKLSDIVELHAKLYLKSVDLEDVYKLIEKARVAYMKLVEIREEADSNDKSQ